MRFTIENEPFSKAMVLVKACVPARSTIPILSHVVLEAKAESIVTIRATNMEREAEVMCKAEVTEPGSTTLPGDVLSALVRKLAKGGQAQFSIAEDRCGVVSGSSRYALRTLPASDYPTAKDVSAEALRFTVDGASLAKQLRFVVHAASEDRTRYYLGGVHLHVDGRQLVAVATDGQRLALARMEMPKGAATLPSIIVPTAAVQHMIEVADAAVAADDASVDVAVTSKMIEIKTPRMRMTSQLVDGEYPDYRRVIPKANGSAISSIPYSLAEAIDRVCVVHGGALSPDALPFVGFDFKDDTGELRYGSRATDTATETIEAVTNGGILSFRTNAQHLADLLKVWPETAPVEIQQHGGDRAPILFTMKDHPECLAVIMPVAKGGTGP